jgi:homocysteine S-methyltransferase
MPFIGDGGLETTMIFEHGFELPEFASFLLLDDERGRAALRSYYEGYIDLAAAHGVGFTLDTPTWRASRNWGERLGRSAAAITDRRLRHDRARGRRLSSDPLPHP